MRTRNIFGKFEIFSKKSVLSCRARRPVNRKRGCVSNYYLKLVVWIYFFDIHSGHIKHFFSENFQFYQSYFERFIERKIHNKGHEVKMIQRKKIFHKNIYNTAIRNWETRRYNTVWWRDEVSSCYRQYN